MKIGTPSIADGWDLSRLNRNFKEAPMHDAIVALVFVAIVMAPCVVALASNVDGPGSN